MPSPSINVEQGVVNNIENNHGTIDIDVSYNLNLKLNKYLINPYTIALLAVCLFLIGGFIYDTLLTKLTDPSTLSWVLATEKPVRALLFIFLLPLILEYINKRSARELQLACADKIKLKSDIHQYFKTTPYRKADRANYARPDFSESYIKSWLETNQDEKFLYLTGRSGSGKSSLINCRLLPVLESAGYNVHSINLRDCSDATTVLKFDQPKEINIPNNQYNIYVIDQFEEIFYRRDDSAYIWSFLQDALKGNIENAYVMISIRDDYKEELTKFGLPAMIQYKNWQSLNEYDYTTAINFIKGKIDLDKEINLSLLIQDEFSRVDRKPGFVRLITINMIGVALEYINSHGYRAKKIKEAFDLGLINFYLQTVCSKKEVSSYVTKIFNILVSNRGNDARLSTEAIAGQLRKPADETRGVLSTLELYGLIFKSKNDTWCIAHDFIETCLFENLRTKKLITKSKILAVIAVPLIFMITGAALTLSIFHKEHKTYEASYYINNLNGLGVMIRPNMKDITLDLDHYNAKLEYSESLETVAVQQLTSLKFLNINRLTINSSVDVYKSATRIVDLICSTFKPIDIKISNQGHKKSSIEIDRAIAQCSPQSLEIVDPFSAYIPLGTWNDKLRSLKIESQSINDDIEIPDSILHLDELYFDIQTSGSHLLLDMIAAKKVSWKSPIALPGLIIKTAKQIELYLDSHSETDLCMINADRTHLIYLVDAQDGITNTKLIQAASFIGETVETLASQCNILATNLDNYHFTVRFKTRTDLSEVVIALKEYDSCWREHNKGNYREFSSCIGLPVEKAVVYEEAKEIKYVQ